MKTKTNDEIIRKELLKIAKERGIEVNKFWTNKILAHRVTQVILDRIATKNLRAWQKRRLIWGVTGMKKVTYNRTGDRTWWTAIPLFAHPNNTGAVAPNWQ